VHMFLIILMTMEKFDKRACCLQSGWLGRRG